LGYPRAHDPHDSPGDDSGGRAQSRWGGERLGYDAEGRVHESIPTGSFLDIGGVEYASVSALTKTYDVRVAAVEEGKFLLASRIVRPGRILVHSYPPVTCGPGTTAALRLTPAQVTESLPPLSATQGVLVVSVVLRSPAQAAGLQTGDIIVVNGQQVGSPEALTARVRALAHEEQPVPLRRQLRHALPEGRLVQLPRLV